jgi:carbohydrate-binding DOMON domain-containing protein
MLLSLASQNAPAATDRTTDSQKVHATPTSAASQGSVIANVPGFLVVHPVAAREFVLKLHLVTKVHPAHEIASSG